ncbi:MAG: carboxypeptidase-like regulatory domain-containing protein [Actinomycetota bacterium]|nr:carboxypeptidase-like regulatory domain-containing protein [Actinomycetota bacterium]
MSTEEGGGRNWIKPALAILVPVVAALLITILTPLGDRLRDLLFPSTSTVRGLVRLQGNSVPAADVLLDGREHAVSEANGSFVLRGVPAGDHTLTITALGARTHRLPFVVKRNSEETELGVQELTPSLRLAGEASGGLEPPSNPGKPTFRMQYELAIWLEGDDEVISRVRRVRYVLPRRLRPAPIDVFSRDNRFCFQMKDAIELRIGETVEGSIDALVTFDGGRTLQLSSSAAEKLPAGRRPSNCD